jgi:GT2 family glycosyltransferase
MKIALISTVFNEGDGIFAWAESLRQQTRQPDEFVIVDGGSTDGTPERLRAAFSHGDFPAPRIIVEKCNIARGRNLAIQNTTAEIVAVNDAGSFPDKNWLGEITRPLVESKNLDVVGGGSKSLFENEFQKFVEQFENQPVQPARAAETYPSSRNVAFRRQAWADVGGYPEWLTLTAEDALFNFQLHKIGKQFFYNPAAIVHWPVRDTAPAYFKMYHNYGYGAAEARLYTQNYLRHWLITIFPALLLLSRHRFGHLKFRYQKNAASAFGWLAGRVKGHSAPENWRRIDGILLSPEACAHRPSNPKINL